MTVNETVLNSVMLLDKCILELLKTINKLESIEYESILYSSMNRRISVLLNQVYTDRAKQNYKSAFRKCIFLRKYIEKEMRLLDGTR